MNFRNKFGIIFLSLILMLSLLFPFCCHSQNSSGASHHSEISEQAAHSSHHNEVDCSCGHRLIEDFQKNKKVVSSLHLDVNLESGVTAFVPFDHLSLSGASVIHTVHEMSGLPVHLLNSVFLN